MDPALLSELLGVAELPGRLEMIEQRLSDTLQVDAPSLSAPVRRVSAGGKRLRPALTIASAEIGGVFDPKVLAAAVAVELVQVGSLVHDDILDDADTRHGVPTINRVEGPNPALMAGDFLLARAGSESAVAGQPVAAEIAGAVAALCEGQIGEMRHAFDVDRPIDSYLRSIDGKTAALFACSCRVGALCAGMAHDDVERLGRFGRSFGMAFQVLDDTLDLIGDPGQLGKPVGLDLDAGVYTLPVLLELQQRSGGDLRALLRRRGEEDLALALRLVRGASHLEESISVARSFADQASAAIATLPGGVAGRLRTFPRSYIDWALDYFIEPDDRAVLRS